MQLTKGRNLSTSMMMSEPVCLDDFEEVARRVLPVAEFDFIQGGADGEVTLRENVRAWSRYQLLPRVMRDVSQRDTSSSILGHQVALPVCVAPVGCQSAAHPKAEAASASAAAALCIPFSVSSMSSCSLDEIYAAAPKGLKFFQVYLFEQRDITEQLVLEAGRRGFSALMLTIDVPVMGNRTNDKRNKFVMPFPRITGKPVPASGVPVERAFNFANNMPVISSRVTWQDVKWLQSISSLPIVIKGILTADAAEEAVQCGVQGIIVSNHGGRQLDTTPATVSVLRSVVAAVRGRCEVYVDGGVRRGTDVLKALALGATAVFLGRPILYGLAYKGEEGVRSVLEMIRDEFSTAMALTGCTKVSEIDSRLIIHKSEL